MVKTITTCVTPDDEAFIDFNKVDVAKLIRATIAGMRAMGITKTDGYETLMREAAGILKKTESANLAEALAVLMMKEIKRNGNGNAVKK